MPATAAETARAVEAKKKQAKLSGKDKLKTKSGSTVHAGQKSRSKSKWNEDKDGDGVEDSVITIKNGKGSARVTAMGDEDGDGVLSDAEKKAVGKKLEDAQKAQNKARNAENYKNSAKFKQKQAKAASEARRNEIDADGDGILSAEERAAYEQKQFDLADADGDGKLTAAEMAAAKKKGIAVRPPQSLNKKSGSPRKVHTRPGAAIDAREDIDGDGILDNVMQTDDQTTNPNDDRAGKKSKGRYGRMKAKTGTFVDEDGDGIHDNREEDTLGTVQKDSERYLARNQSAPQLSKPVGGFDIPAPPCAWELTDAELDTMDAEAAGASYNAAAAKVDLGDLSLLTNLQWTARKRFEKKFGRHHVHTYVAMNNHGVVEIWKNDRDEGIWLYRHAFKGLRKILGPEHKMVLDIEHNLGLALRETGDLPRTEKLYRKCLKNYKKVLGPEDDDTMRMHMNLGNILRMRGDIDDGMRHYAIALNGFRKEYGDMHITTLHAGLGLGLLISHRHDHMTQALNDRNGNLNAAMNQASKAEIKMHDYINSLEDYENALSPEPPMCLDTGMSLVLGYKCYDPDPADAKFMALKQDRADENMAMIEKLLSKHGPACRKMMLEYHDWGLRLWQKDEDVEACRTLLEAYRFIEDELGRNHPATLIAAHNVAMCAKDGKDYECATRMYRRVMEGHEQVLGPEHLETQEMKMWFADTLRRKGRLHEAARHYRECMDIRIHQLGAEHFETLSSAFGLSLTLGKLDKLDRPCEAHRRAIERLEKRLWSDKPRIIQCITEHVPTTEKKLSVETGEYDATKFLPLELQRVNRNAATPTTKFDVMPRMDKDYARGVASVRRKKPVYMFEVRRMASEAGLDLGGRELPPEIGGDHMGDIEGLEIVDNGDGMHVVISPKSHEKNWGTGVTTFKGTIRVQEMYEEGVRKQQYIRLGVGAGDLNG